MRPAIWLLILCTLGGCNRAPTFDERYTEASNGVHASARAIEQEMKVQMTGARDAERAAAEAAASATPGNRGMLP